MIRWRQEVGNVKKEKVPKDLKKKPKYTLWQNRVYYFKILRQFNSKVIYMVAVGIPFSVLATLLSMYTPKIILDRLEFSNTFTKIAFIIVGIFAVKLINDLINNGIDAQKQLYECFILGKHTARKDVASISPPRREFQKC